MRCKNCGWDNPEGNVRCEKCNASLGEYAGNERTPRYDNGQVEYAPRATVAASDPDGYDLRATVVGCATCGYPVRLGETECPVCGQGVPGAVKEPENVMPVAAGTIIQGANVEKEAVNPERRKLTGFLVTYSRLPNGRFFPLFEGKNTIGRAASSNVHIQGDSAVSEKHLSILYRTVDKKFKFKDEQSSNGTFINEQLTDEGELQNYDKIRIGTTGLVFLEIPVSSFE